MWFLKCYASEVRDAREEGMEMCLKQDLYVYLERRQNIWDHVMYVSSFSLGENMFVIHFFFS